MSRADSDSNLWNSLVKILLEAINGGNGNE